MWQQLSRLPVRVMRETVLSRQIDQTPGFLLIQCGSDEEVRICIWLHRLSRKLKAIFAPLGCH